MSRTVTYMLAVFMALAYPKCGLSAQGDTLLEVSGGHGLWTLEDCIDYALEHNIEIKRQELVPDDRRSALSDARWSYVPSFSVGSSYSLSAGRVLDETTYDFVENETVGSSSLSLSGGRRRH